MIPWRAMLATSACVGFAAGCGIAAAEVAKCKLGLVAEWPTLDGASKLIYEGLELGGRLLDW